MKKIAQKAGSMALVSMVFFPFIVLAASDSGLIVCSGNDCNVDKFILLLNNIVLFLFKISIPFVVCIMIYAGFLFLMAGGDTGAVKKAKGIFWTILVGFVLMLVAWLIVNFITTVLLKENYTYFK